MTDGTEYLEARQVVSCPEDDQWVACCYVALAGEREISLKDNQRNIFFRAAFLFTLQLNSVDGPFNNKSSFNEWSVIW